MSERWEDAQGRTKEAVGDLTDDANLKRDGKSDQVSARAKGAANDAIDRAHKFLDDARAKGKSVMDRFRERRARRTSCGQGVERWSAPMV
jgi:uncharacterized protein YjbJ (UPF0337 family)